MKTKFFLGLAAACVISGSSAFAAPITATYDTFGTLPAATFGGSGIPNNAVAITTFTTNGDTITLGMTATPRYPNNPITSMLPNNGAGTFYTDPGVGVTPGRANWNFNYYINLSTDLGNTDVYTFKLLYANNSSGASNTVTFTSPTVLSGTTQDSQNLSFAFFGTPILYDVNATAQYGFELQAYNALGAPVGRPAAINVNVGSVPDVASSALLLAFGLAGILAFRQLQDRSATV